jgi:hypothetical protein
VAAASCGIFCFSPAARRGPGVSTPAASTLCELRSLLPPELPPVPAAVFKALVTSVNS